MRSLYTFGLPDSGAAPIALADNTMAWALECIAARQLRLRRAKGNGGDGSSGVIVQRLLRHTTKGSGARTAIASSQLDPKLLAAPGSGFISSAYAGSNAVPANAAIDGPNAYNAQGGAWFFEDDDGVIIHEATDPWASLGVHHDLGSGGTLKFTLAGAWTEGG